MKAFNTLAVIAALLLCGHAGFAQQRIPEFGADSEKEAWIKSHQQQYDALLKSNRSGVADKAAAQGSINTTSNKLSRTEMMNAASKAKRTAPVSRVVSNELFSSEEEKMRWKQQIEK